MRPTPESSGHPSCSILKDVLSRGPRTKESKELVVIVFVPAAKLLLMNEFATSAPQHLLSIGQRLIPCSCDTRPTDAPDHLLAQCGAGRVEG